MNTQAGVDSPRASALFACNKESSEKHVLPTPYLPSLNGFKIENAKFKHYCHVVSSQPLDKNMHPGTTEPAASPTNSHHVKSPLDSPSDHMARALELSAHKLYSEAAVSQMLLLRIEQERTRQIQEKAELGRVVAKLIEDAKAHGFSSELIRRLFLDEDRDECKSHIEKLHTQAASGKFKTPPEQPQKTALSTTTQSLCTPSPNKLPMASATLMTRPNSVSLVVSNLLASSRHTSYSHYPDNGSVLPPLVAGNKEHYARALSEGLIGPGSGREPGPATEAPSSGRATAAATPTMATAQTSPGVPMIPQQAYLAYYAGAHEQHTHSHGRSQTRAVSLSHTQEGMELGLPHSHNYSTAVYQSLPPYPTENGAMTTIQSEPQSAPSALHHEHHHEHPHQHEHQHQQQARVLQHHQYSHVQPYSYVHSLPPGVGSGPAMASSHYFVPPPMTPGTPMGVVRWATPSVPHEKHRRDDDKDPHAYKKYRGSKIDISFMISTPKNPPVRKYNKPSGTT